MQKSLILLVCTASVLAVSAANNARFADWKAQLPRPIYDERPEFADLYFGKVTCSIVATTDKIEVESNAAFILRANGCEYAVRVGRNVFDRRAKETVVVREEGGGNL